MGGFFKNFKRLSEGELRSLAKLTGGMAVLVLLVLALTGTLPGAPEPLRLALNSGNRTVNTAAVFNSNSPGTYTWTAPSGVTQAWVTVVGGGGGGGRGSWTINACSGDSYTGGGGGAGGAIVNQPVSVTPGQDYTITIGAGGPGGTDSWCQSGIPGTAGGSSSIVGPGVNVAAGGGGGGAAGPPSTGGTAGSPGGVAGQSGGDYCSPSGTGGDNGSGYGKGGTASCGGGNGSNPASGQSGQNGYVLIYTSLAITATPQSVSPGGSTVLSWQLGAVNPATCTIKNQNGTTLVSSVTQSYGVSTAYTVPSFSLLQVSIFGAGGGGGGGAGGYGSNTNGSAGSTGGTGATTYFGAADGALGGTGGGGGNPLTNLHQTVGPAGSNGSGGGGVGSGFTYVGSGNAGGAGGAGGTGVSGYTGGPGGTGGAGGKVIKQYNVGDLVSGGQVSITIGAGGAGGAGGTQCTGARGSCGTIAQEPSGQPGSTGSAGSVSVSYFPAPTFTVNNITTNSTFTIACNDLSGNPVSASVTVTAGAPPTATITSDATKVGGVPTMTVGGSMHITANYSAGSGDTLTGDGINPDTGGNGIDSGNSVPCADISPFNASCWLQPDAQKIYTFSTNTPGSYTFFADAKTANFTNYQSLASVQVNVACPANYTNQGGSCICTLWGPDGFTCVGTGNCPAHSSPSGNQCVCNSGYQVSGDSCVATPSGSITTQLTASPSRVRSGGGTSLSWATTGMSSCSVKDDSGNTVSTQTSSGGTAVNNITHQTTYTLSCTDGTNNYTSAVKVTLVPQVQEI